MEKYKKYAGVLIFVAVVFLLLYVAVKIVTPRITEVTSLKEEVTALNGTLEQKNQARANVARKIAKIKNSIVSSQKKIYAPIESDLGNDTLFFTLYNDVIEMLHADSIKIKSIDYQYNPEQDAFVQSNKDGMYFVCDVNMELVSNYVNLGKLIQDIYQYPYYIKINGLEVSPYKKDKKILISNLSLRLYARTAPEEATVVRAEEAPLAGATSPIPTE